MHEMGKKSTGIKSYKVERIEYFPTVNVVFPVMRVLGIPSRVVTVFNAAHDTNGNLSIEEYYSNMGEKLNLTRDSVWLVPQLWLVSHCIVLFG